jgi:hypothetical protein
MDCRVHCRPPKIRVIEKVEEFGAELQAKSLAKFSLTTPVRPPVKTLCAIMLEKERMVIANTLGTKKCRHRTSRSCDSVIAPATGSLIPAMVLATEVCLKLRLGARSAPRKIDERYDGFESRLITFVAARRLVNSA